MYCVLCTVYYVGKKVHGAGFIQLLLLGGGQACVPCTVPLCTVYCVGRESSRSWHYPTTPPLRWSGVCTVYYCVGKESTRSWIYPTTPPGRWPGVCTVYCVLLCREGKYKELGLSNYSSWEVARCVEICRKHDWLQPTVYQVRI